MIVRGTSRQMGAQYLDRSLDIFGSFAFSGYTARGLTGDHIATIDRWAQELQAHAPDTLEYASAPDAAMGWHGVHKGCIGPITHRSAPPQRGSHG